MASSRQSLLGSRSQLASPATERPAAAPTAMTSSAPERTEKKSSISPPEYTSVSKRESFVEVEQQIHFTTIDITDNFIFRLVFLKLFALNLPLANR